ncbi:MAG: hypothetical protein ACOC3X_03600 [Nanoarchaeota archaeon]
MKKSNNKGLENLLLKDNCKNTHDHHFHPHEFIANHVIFVVFLAMLFLTSLFVFLLAAPTDDVGTAYALFEFKPINLGIMDKVSSVKDVFVNNLHREEFLFMIFLCWIFIVGAINLHVTEKKYKIKK